MLLKKNFAIKNKSLGKVDDSSEEYYLLSINPPWDTYLENKDIWEVQGLYLGIYLDFSQAFFLIDTGEDMIKTDDWTPSSDEKQMIKSYVEDFYENDNSEEELLRKCI